MWIMFDRSHRSMRTMAAVAFPHARTIRGLLLPRKRRSRLKMPVRAQITLLPDGRRLHMHDGPIDLIVEAFGSPDQVRVAYDAASARFEHVLDELCAELSLLRRPPSPDHQPAGVVAQRMFDAVSPYFPQNFITSMAAVAGAVAEEIL